jgi:hypothetical protein
MGVPGCYRQIVLPGHGGDPEVIVWYELTKLSELGFDFSIMLGREEIARNSVES